MTARENVRLDVGKWAKLDGITPDLSVMLQTRHHQRFRCYALVDAMHLFSYLHTDQQHGTAQGIQTEGLSIRAVRSRRGLTSVIPSSFRDDYLSSAGVLNVESFFC